VFSIYLHTKEGASGIERAFTDGIGFLVLIEGSRVNSMLMLILTF